MSEKYLIHNIDKVCAVKVDFEGFIKNIDREKFIGYADSLSLPQGGSFLSLIEYAPIKPKVEEGKLIRFLKKITRKNVKKTNDIVVYADIYSNEKPFRHAHRTTNIGEIPYDDSFLEDQVNLYQSFRDEHNKLEPIILASSNVIPYLKSTLGKMPLHYKVKTKK